MEFCSIEVFKFIIMVMFIPYSPHVDNTIKSIARVTISDMDRYAGQ